MDFAYTSEQEMLRDSVARYLERSYDFDTRQALVASDEPWSREVWATFAALGLLALPFGEEQGGLGGSAADGVAFAQVFGHHLVVEPHVATVFLAGAALEAAGGEQARSWLAKVIAGESIAAFAYEEGAGTAHPDQIAAVAEPADSAYVLSGEKRMVIAGGEADVLLVVARAVESGPLAFFLVDPEADGVAISAYQTIDGRSAANIRFDQVRLSKDALILSNADTALRQIITDALIVMSAEAVGAMGALLEITSDYAMTRKQFGQPIASFQAVAHRLADMKIAYTKALSTLTYTAALAASGAATLRDIAILKGQIGKLARALGEAAIQTHGGVGLTDELSVGHYHKRLIAYDAMLGDHAYHLRMVGSGEWSG